MEKLYGVIGDPIHHSMSPLIHNFALQKHRLHAHYTAFHVKAEKLEDAFKGFRAIQLAGLNVTIPHKQSIIPLLDEVDPLARDIGAVNTVVLENGKYVGYNTDGPGFIRQLKNIDRHFSRKKVLIIGSGGAARAIYFSLAKEKVQTIDMANRTIQKARTIINDCPYQTESQALALIDAEKCLDQYDILIQTTSIGMFPNIHETPIQIKRLKENTIVIDIIYNPFETKFLQEAKKHQAIIANGIDMFIHQAALSFELWTNQAFPVEDTKKLVIKQLGGDKC